MASFVPTSAETLEDQRLYTSARLVEVACLDCLAKVGVKKNSEHHTSIQWTDRAMADCQEFARMAYEPGGRRVYAACSSGTSKEIECASAVSSTTSTTFSS